jgi:hypothetical protein
MKSITASCQRPRRTGLRPCLWALCWLAITSPGRADAPIDPLPVPDYSFDLTSWTLGEVEGLDARDVLYLDFPHPGELVPGDTLGLASSEDDLDALSSGNTSVTPEDKFALLFSVDADSVGAVPSHPKLIALNVPYNVMDQAARGHAAGDQFMSTHLFTLLGALGGPMSNNVLTRNNYDEGGTDFSARPPNSAGQPAVDDTLDVVNAMARLARSDDGEMVLNVYFSLAADSPSLGEMPTYSIPSGADIYYNEDPLAYAPTALYAAYEQMQLDLDDDIDALVVFDTNDNACFDGSDVVLFSLTPDSPSLETIFGASPDGAAADVFVVTPGQMPAVFAAAADLGLGDPLDNLDALDFFFCDDVLFCAAQHGIRAPRGDLDGDGCVNDADLGIFLSNWGCTGKGCSGDIDGDGDTDHGDLGILLGQWGEGCP